MGCTTESIGFEDSRWLGGGISKISLKICSYCLSNADVLQSPFPPGLFSSQGSLANPKYPAHSSAGEFLGLYFGHSVSRSHSPPNWGAAIKEVYRRCRDRDPGCIFTVCIRSPTCKMELMKHSAWMLSTKSRVLKRLPGRQLACLSIYFNY